MTDVSASLGRSVSPIAFASIPVFLEISLAPVGNISDAEKIYSDFRKLTDPMLAEYGYELVCSGYREKGRADELELIPKKRYEFMNKYFENS